MQSRGALPSGTVTFLFTDIERSTETVAALGDERYAELQETHRRLLREAFAAHEGVEVGSEGDALFVAFARAGDAVHAAIDGQRALHGHALRVRMGLHTGEALMRDGDYVGHDVHKAKRVSDAGHGGQILLSPASVELVRGTIEVTDLGPHRLKDLGEPQHLFQVKADGLGEDFPALRTLDAAPHNLPVQLTSFVGRERELEEVAGLLAKHRLVTLTGVGGCGKTRLSIHAAAAEFGSSPDGVFFCDLSRLADDDALVPALARTLGLELTVQQGAALPALDAVRNFLARRNTLVVLDNCEHIVSAVAGLVEDLLTSCAHLRVLATSREALEVSGEQTWSIPSLDAAGEAAQLFAERAAAVRGDFVLTEENKPHVDAICERLDGIPLAIELAAAQIGHLGPRQIAERLDDRFMILTGGRRRVQRQQTLHAAMDWSWDLLDARDQTLLRRLSVFQGGCTLDAAEAVCGDGIDVVSGLRSLVAKSLVIAEQRDGAARYRLLETVRLYAEDKQAGSGESEELRTRHRDHCLAWAEAIPVERTLWGPTFTLSELLPEEDNIRAALRWSDAQERPDLMARLLASTRRVWLYHHAEAPRWFDSVLAAELPDELRGKLLVAKFMAALAPMNPVTREQMDEAIRLLSAHPSPWLVQVRCNQAIVCLLVALATRDQALADRATELSDAAVDLGRVLGPFVEATALASRGALLLMHLRHREAADAFAEAVRITPRDNPVGGVITQVIEGLRSLRHIMGESWSGTHEAALATALREVDPRRRDDASPLTLSRLLERADTGDVAGAHADLRAHLLSVRERAPAVWFSIPFSYGGALAGLRGDWERAARLLAAAMSPGFISSPAAYVVYRHWVPKVREALGAQRARELREEGRAMSLQEAIAYALEEPTSAVRPGG
jgi:predicted ATPase/class 3 adenylate cyclase